MKRTAYVGRAQRAVTKYTTHDPTIKNEMFNFPLADAAKLCESKLPAGMTPTHLVMDNIGMLSTNAILDSGVCAEDVTAFSHNKATCARMRNNTLGVRVRYTSAEEYYPKFADWDALWVHEDGVNTARNTLDRARLAIANRAQYLFITFNVSRRDNGLKSRRTGRRKPGVISHEEFASAIHQIAAEEGMEVLEYCDTLESYQQRPGKGNKMRPFWFFMRRADIADA